MERKCIFLKVGNFEQISLTALGGAKAGKLFHAEQLWSNAWNIRMFHVEDQVPSEAK